MVEFLRMIVIELKQIHCITIKLINDLIHHKN